jgi:hypothetical protein
MNKIEYEIKLNDAGRPCIELSKDYEDKPEDKFFSIELARYVLQQVYARRSAEFDQEASKSIENGIALLGQIGDEIANLLWENMKNVGDMSFHINKNYHIIVDTIEERDNLNPEGILQGNRLYLRQEGLKVFVTSENKIYELKNGITNENWKEI